MQTIETEYLELRPLPEADLAELHKVYQGTPLYFDGIGLGAPQLTPAHVRAQWQAAQGANRYLFGVYHQVVGRLIGAVELRLDAPEPGAATVWLLVWGGFQRQGYGQEVLAAVVEYLNANTETERLYAIAAANAEGQSFLRLQGFVPTDTPVESPVGGGRVALWALGT